MLVMMGERSAEQSMTKPSSIMPLKSVTSEGPSATRSAPLGVWQGPQYTVMTLAAAAPGTPPLDTGFSSGSTTGRGAQATAPASTSADAASPPHAVAQHDASTPAMARHRTAPIDG